ncbi:hypothetical protein PSAB6_110115 [Paraburkholderia sabiae]|nr:hypothetical protein PSAB6_110115 [Paraburkholderia sabiae]
MCAIHRSRAAQSRSVSGGRRRRSGSACHGLRDGPFNGVWNAQSRQVAERFDGVGETFTLGSGETADSLCPMGVARCRNPMSKPIPGPCFGNWLH